MDPWAVVVGVVEEELVVRKGPYSYACINGVRKEEGGGFVSEYAERDRERDF